MHRFSLAWTVLLILCNSPDLTKGADVACTVGATTYSCYDNVNSIDCSLVNDGVRDCPDNSDEGTAVACSRAGQYKCKDGTNCVDATQADDGFFRDCLLDGTDEYKIIGEACNATNDDVRNIGCSVYIYNSQCGSSFQCECVTGSYMTGRNSSCTWREYNDTCSATEDCSAASVTLTCDTSTSLCICADGYYLANSGDANCTQIGIGDPCRHQADCVAIMNNATCNSTSQCECDGPLHLDRSDLTNCRGRFLNETCSTDEQCNIDLTYAICNTTTLQCDCNVAGYMNSTYDGCARRVINDTCVSDAECGYIDNGLCDSTGSTCVCNAYAIYFDHEGLDCYYGLKDLYCTFDYHCQWYFQNSVCYNKVCYCTNGYYESNSNLSCALFKLGDGGCNDHDCRTAITNGDCDSSLFCNCPDLYSQSSDYVCEYAGQASTGPPNIKGWAIFLIIMAALFVIALVVVFILARPWEKPSKSEAKEPVRTDWTYGLKSGKAVWTLRPPSGIKAMYSGKGQGVAYDAAMDSFFHGGSPPHSSRFEDNYRTKSATRRVHFDQENTSITPFTPETIRSTQTPSRIDFSFDQDHMATEGFDEFGQPPYDEQEGKKKKKKKKKSKK